MTNPSDARSALNLRLVLALGGAVLCLLLGVLAWNALPVAFAVVLVLLAVVGFVDALVILKRRQQRAEAHESSGHSHDSLFE